MATFAKFDKFVLNLGNKIFNLGSDTLKVALTNSAPTGSTNNQLSDITQITAANGYSSGGTTASTTSYTQTSGTAKLILVDVTFTASGGSIGPFRYVVLYDSTAINSELIGYWDYGTNITVTDGNSFLVDFDATNGVLQLA